MRGGAWGERGTKRGRQRIINDNNISDAAALGSEYPSKNEGRIDQFEYLMIRLMKVMTRRVNVDSFRERYHRLIC